MAWNIAPAPALHLAPPSRLYSVSSFSSLHTHCNDYGFRDPSTGANPISLSIRPQKLALLQSFAFRRKPQKKGITTPLPDFKGPPPIPAFADAEIKKFRAYLLSKFTARPDVYGEGEEVQEYLDICTEIFSEFLHKEYGGPGTLMVDPFIDMNDAMEERELPAGAQAAERAVKWARKHLDKDWIEWTGGDY